MAAQASSPPVYTLKIVEGETTLPENPIVYTSGEVNPHAPIAVSIVRGGIVVAKTPPSSNGSAGMSLVPQAGDLVRLESPVGTVIESVTYDGLPSIDPTVCAGSTNFSGQNTLGMTVKGHAVALAVQIEKYGSSIQQSSFQHAQVTMLSGTTFGGSFLTQLALGQTVTAEESLETQLAYGVVFNYISETARPVAGCPPVVPPPPPPPPPALQGTIMKLPHVTILTLLKTGLRDLVTINQPGSVTQDLYLEDGTLPALAATSKHKHHRKPPPALLLARGATAASGAGTVTVSLKLTSKGRAKLRSARNLRAVLVTTLRTSSGAKLNLARRVISLHR
ncbi:MAG TPA: hypothetical protein VK790_01365 [Solirubrobacteraceae bacterium]|nr:hypothetical protein [Solirubrobacteraceae bacterium]